MASNDLWFEQWVAAHSEFAEKVNRDFLNNPKATLDWVYPAGYRGRGFLFEGVLREYLQDCGCMDFLGECFVNQDAVYTSSLFKGRKNLCVITHISYGHWGTMPKGIIKESFLVSTPDKKAAIGVALKVTDGKEGHDFIVFNNATKRDEFFCLQEDWDYLKKKLGLLLAKDIDLYYYLTVSSLLEDQCPSNVFKLKFDPVY